MNKVYKMGTDMNAIQAVISHAHKRGGLESIALISSLGLPVASVGIDMNLGVAARTIFSIFDRASSELNLGQSEHILVGGTSRNVIVKPLRKPDGSLLSWFVAVSPSFGRKISISPDQTERSILVTSTGVSEPESLDSSIDETHLFSATTALWSGIQMLSANIELGEITGALLDGESKRFILVPEDENWRVAIARKERRVGKVDVELDRAAVMLKDLL